MRADRACRGRRRLSWRGPARSPLLVVSAAVGGVALLQWLYTALVRLGVRYAVARIRVGDAKPLLRLYAKDVRFVFPGNGAWAADVVGRDEVESWLERFVRVGFELEGHEIVVNGPPWRTTVCTHFTDRFFGNDRELIYANSGIMFARSSWGKIRVHLVYEDTQRGAAFEEWLTVHRPELAETVLTGGEQASP
jgi:hypothetical protein